MTKATHPGYAAALGLESALLAQRGFTANPEVFEARQGYVPAFLPKTFDAGQLLRFGPPFRVMQPGFALKAFPCKYQTHYTIVCGLAAREQIASAEDITEVRITSPVFPAADRPRPRSGLEGMFSLQFTFAAALLDGAVNTATFTDQRVADPRLQSLLGKTSLTMDPDDLERVRRQAGHRRGRAARRQCRAHELRQATGILGGPPIPQAQYREKLLDCLGSALPPADIERCIELASRTDTLEPAELRSLMRLCRGSESGSSARNYAR